jgi:large subunit ribosomal protein L9
MAFMEVILLERVENLGSMGETVRVKPGYARNFLLPQKKALRATNENKAFYEAQRAELEKRNAEKRADAEKLAKKLEGFKATVIRNAAESGALYGSVTTRDVAEAVTAQAKVQIDRTKVMLNLGFKSIGLFDVALLLHPEVKVDIVVNIARTAEEAKIQAETGKALVAVDDRTAEANAKAEAAAEAAAKAEKAALLEAEALANEQERAEAGEAKAEKKAAKKSKKADDAANDDGAEDAE